VRRRGHGKRQPGQEEYAAIRALVSSALKEEILLGWQEMVALGILTRRFPPVYAVTPTTQGHKELAEEFPEVFEEDKIKPMKGKPMKIHLAGR
jgi:hypothetical protein